MINSYEVNVDVTMGGWLYVDAESKEEAERIAKEKLLVASDLRNFCHLSTEVIDVTDVDEM